VTVVLLIVSDRWGIFVSLSCHKRNAEIQTE